MSRADEIVLIEALEKLNSQKWYTSQCICSCFIEFVIHPMRKRKKVFKLINMTLATNGKLVGSTGPVAQQKHHKQWRGRIEQGPVWLCAEVLPSRGPSNPRPP